MSTLHDFGGVLAQAFGHFLLGFHNYMVMALGSQCQCPRRFRDVISSIPSVSKSDYMLTSLVYLH